MIPKDPIVVLTSKGEIKGLPVEYYPNGEPLIRGPVEEAEGLLIRPRIAGDWLAALYLLDAWATRGVSIPRKVVIPAFPGQRQDRPQNEDGANYLVNLKGAARGLNRVLNMVTTVVVLDPHSKAVQEELGECGSKILTAWWAMRDIQHEEWSFVVAPDKGASKRAAQVARRLGVHCFIGEKRRDPATGELSDFFLPPTTACARGSVGLVVDDICDGGATFEVVGRALAERGLSADLWVTHGYFTRGVKALSKWYRKIYTTDSCAQFHEALRGGKLKVVPVCERMLRGEWK